MEKAINDLTRKLTTNTYTKLLHQAQDFANNIENFNDTNDDNKISKEDLLINLETVLREYINNIREEMIGLGLEIGSNENIINSIANSTSGQDAIIVKLKNENEMLKKTLSEYEIKSEIKLNIKIEEVKSMYRAKITSIRHKVTDKYKKALDSLREEKDKEMNIMVDLVRKECEDIFSEANKMIQHERDKKVNNSKELMLTPNVTKQLVETILGRSATDNELRALFDNHNNNRVAMTPDGKLIVKNLD